MTKFLTLNVLLVLSLFSCQQTEEELEGSDLDAIVSADGNNAFGLVAMRHYAKKPTTELNLTQYREFENGLRLAFGITYCSGENAADKVSRVEAIANIDADLVRHKGKDIFLYANEVEVKVEGCHLFGSDMLGGASFIGIFTEEAKSQEDFEVQQLFWLAMRGRNASSKNGFSQGFNRFLDENLGAGYANSPQATLAEINKFDGIFNPYAPNVGNVPFDREALFAKDSKGDFVLKKDFNKVFKSFADKIRILNEEFLSVTKDLTPEAAAAVQGTEVALKVNATPKFNSAELPSDAAANKNGPLAPAGQLSEKLDPRIALLLPYSDKVTSLFQIILGTSPGKVISWSLPRSGHDSPDITAMPAGLRLATETSEANMNKAGWTKVKGTDTYQQKMSNGKMATTKWNGSGWNTSTWKPYDSSVTGKIEYTREKNYSYRLSKNNGGYYQVPVSAATNDAFIAARSTPITQDTLYSPNISSSNGRSSWFKNVGGNNYQSVNSGQTYALTADNSIWNIGQNDITYKQAAANTTGVLRPNPLTSAANIQPVNFNSQYSSFNTQPRYSSNGDFSSYLQQMLTSLSGT